VSWKGSILLLARLLSLLLILAPILFLLTGLSFSGSDLLFSSRQVGLLGKSLLFSAASAFLASLAGLAAAMGLFFRLRGRFSRLRWVPLVLLSLPPSLHFLGWKLLASVFPAGGFSGEGWIFAVWVQAMALLPLSAVFLLAGLHRMNPEVLDAARIFAPETETWRRILLPMLWPYLPGCLALVFLLSLTQYTIPALAGCTTWALEIFSRFAATHDVGTALFLSLPITLIGIPLLAVLLGRLRLIFGQEYRRRTPDPGRPDGWPGAVGDAGLALLVLQLGIPLFTLGIEASKGHPFQTMISRLPELGYSLEISIAAVCVTLVTGALLGGRMRRTHTTWTMPAILPLAIPAPLIGIGWGGLAASYFPAWGWVEAILPVVVLSSRFAPVAVLLFHSWSLRQERWLADAVEIFKPEGIRSWRRVYLPMALPVLGAAAGLVLAFSLGELSATLMVLPPGRMSLAVFLYNALHYGATSKVAASSLMLGASCLLAGSLAFFASARWGSR